MAAKELVLWPASVAVEQHTCLFGLLGSAKECASPGHQLRTDGCDPKLHGSSLHDSLLKAAMVLCSIPSSSLCTVCPLYSPTCLAKHNASWAGHAARCCHSTVQAHKPGEPHFIDQLCIINSALRADGPRRDDLQR